MKNYIVLCSGNLFINLIFIIMKTQITPAQMTVIINIQQMANIIGVSGYTLDYLSTKSYDELHEIQNGLIAHYNNAVSNAKGYNK